MRQIAFAILIVCLAVIHPLGASAQANPKYASIVIDADTGAVISERYSNKSLHPASLTKIMTLLLLFEAMENGSVRLNDRITISQRAANQPPSKIGLKAGSTIRVEDAILALVTKSANDISTAIAEHIAGSEDRFALRMTRRAHDIGMSRTTFKNAHGLHHAQQVTTARDMVTLARYVIVRYPNYYRYFSTKQFTYRGVTYNNHNRLMNSYPGMDGFKTGFINASGFNLIASAKKGNRRLIGVVFGGRSWKTRNDHMASILNNAWNQRGDIRHAQAVGTVQVAAASTTPMPRPVPKPVMQGTTAPQVAEIATARVTVETAQQAARTNFTSLSSLENGRKIVAPANTLQLPEGYEENTTERAIESVQTAMNRGDYSELTGEGDFDAVTARRVETGLLAAAVYKGEHEKVRRLQQRQQQQQTAAITPVAHHPNAAESDISNLWSVQIGAYNSRVATDDALRNAHAKLPSELRHAKPIVVPLQTGEGLLFRARLGNMTQNEAVAACNHYRDCLPVAPR